MSYPQWYEIDRVRPEEGELIGSLHAESKRCGKDGCRCQSGREEDLHGPYFYRRWRDEEGKQRKAYVPKREVNAVRAAIEKRRQRLARERATRNRHMRRGQGHGHPAHYWARKRMERKFERALCRLRKVLGGSFV